ncbi:MAG: hypothetical protein HYR96_14635 [Deltaproteobacteria bacterium]|nr:hypothetical protein [Deltaproteobacteria bacterium]MBI3294845.1 hypothetical protein [Deltaproteobacteria bacterium]
MKSIIFGMMATAIALGDVRVSEIHRYVANVSDSEADATLAAFGMNLHDVTKTTTIRVDGLLIRLEHTGSVGGSGFPVFKNNATFDFAADEISATEKEITMHISAPQASRKLFDAMTGVKPKDLGHGDIARELQAGGLSVRCVYSKRGFLSHECAIRIERP